MYGGIRPEIPGHGGEVCANYLPTYQMIGETLLSTTIMIVAGVRAWYTLTMPRIFPKERDVLSKRLLLMFLCLTFGIEIGFKLANRSALYLFNPCHISTIIQVIYHLSYTYTYTQFSFILKHLHIIFILLLCCFFTSFCILDMATRFKAGKTLLLNSEVSKKIVSIFLFILGFKYDITFLSCSHSI